MNQLTQDQVQELMEVARIIAYPKRGTDEERLTIYDAAEMIQSRFRPNDLTSNRQIKIVAWRDSARAELHDAESNLFPNDKDQR